MFPMLDRETREGVQLYLAFLRSGITGEMEEAITLGNVSSVLVVGVWGMQPALLHLPCCAGTGIHFRSVWSLQGNSVLGLGMSGWMDQIEISQWKITIVSLAACHSWWGWLMLMIKKLESEFKKTKSHNYLQSYHPWGPGEHRGRYSRWSKTAQLGRGVTLNTFIWSHTQTHACLPRFLYCQLRTTQVSVCLEVRMENNPSPPSVRLPGGIIQGTPSTSREGVDGILLEGWKGKG